MTMTMRDDVMTMRDDVMTMRDDVMTMRDDVIRTRSCVFMCPRVPQVIMSAIRTRSTLQNLVLTPERIPSFLIPPRSPLLFLSPSLHRSSPDRTRLLSDPDDDSPRLSPVTRPALLRLPPRVRLPRRSAADADTDLTTRAAMSLPHVGKVTTPYGFRAVLTASPCTHRRESLFHKNKAVTVPDGDLQAPVLWTPGPGPDAGRSRVRLQPIKALRLQVLKELRRPAAALKAASPATSKAGRR
ncbi:C2 calcium-dependent domain-containing protein 4C [Collichthys lucidus]|uniref:C2 calcium-dependent domain-containing protein 4C n=1 Tax=Collichthys lucidus TaxID=240159 RepID=A0A4U5VLK9_COLLU|nr:C2 calcium-dependent domain-containing protein 4C [Collichthys lucidus]